MAPQGHVPGDVVAGRYRIERVLAYGGMGAIFAAVPPEGAPELALKVMHETEVGGGGQQRFEREAALLESIDHPHVVPLLDHGITEEGLAFLVFPLLRGRTLKELLRDEGALPIERVGAITLQILSALETTHALGVVHRDIKPDNIFVCEGEGDAIKLIDFGLAKALRPGGAFGEQLTSQGFRLGTPRYMSPEMARGYDSEQASDLYALALVISEMLTGRPLAPQESAIALMMAHASPESLELPNEVLRSPLSPILQRALAKAPAVRYQAAVQMRVDVEAALAPPTGPSSGRWRAPAPPDLASTQLALPVVSVPAPRLPPRRSPLVVALALAVIVLAVVAAVIAKL